MSHPSENRRPFGLLNVTQLKMLTPFDNTLHNSFALVALHFQDYFLGRFRLLFKHRLGLTTKSALFPVISALPLSSQRVLSLFVLKLLVHSMFLTDTRTEGPAGFRTNDHDGHGHQRCYSTQQQHNSLRRMDRRRSDHGGDSDVT